MKLEIAFFLILAAGALLAYFAKCVRKKGVPSLHSGLRILVSSASITGALKVMLYGFSRDMPGGPMFIERDFSLGVALLAGAFCLTWFGAANIISTALEAGENESG